MNKSNGRMKHKNKMLACTACSKGSDAELIHPKLSVPICGACNDSLKDADAAIVDNQAVTCVWCGQGDGCELFMCDTCVNTFCTDCVARNFGSAEAQSVREKAYWTCYLCHPTMKLKEIQISGDVPLYNIDKAYALVHPPKDYDVEDIDPALIDCLSRGEKYFASLLSNRILNSSINDLHILSDYLTANDLFSVIYRISKKLRRLFQSRVFVLPGLFKTEYGEEMGCRLFPHQVVSLHTMLRLENKSSEFGALRGGIFGDEPGLGKTVTTLALISATAGTKPQEPKSFWNSENIDLYWGQFKGNYFRLLAPIINGLLKSPYFEGIVASEFIDIRKNVENYCSSIEYFESSVRNAIRKSVKTFRDREILFDLFRREMNQLKEGLDKKQRKMKKTLSQDMLRIRFERNLKPSSATLIIVPLALLEHWYEQISRHLNLQYFSRDQDFRGVVYLDGLGDLVDIQPPLNRLKLKNNQFTGDLNVLSNYLIVVTTMERCSMEFDSLEKLNDSSSGEKSFISSSSVLLGIRWLRLIVDEGHEMIQVENAGLLAKQFRPNSSNHQNPTPTTQTGVKNSRSLRFASFVTQLAAERRWIMSGTPTTGANSALGLIQLFRLLCFLRHPVLTNHPGEATAEKHWRENVLKPCLSQDGKAWEYLVGVLKGVLLRHTKADIHLFEPIRENVNLEPDYNDDDIPADRRILAVDRAKANYITKTMKKAKEEWVYYRKLKAFHGSPQFFFNSTKRRNRISLGFPQTDPNSPTKKRRLTIFDHDRDEEEKGENQCSLSFGEFNSQENGLITSTIEASEEKKNGFESQLQNSDIPTLQSNTSISVENSNEKNKKDNEDLEVQFKLRRPKAIVFSQHFTDLQGVGHFLYLNMGDSSICEHFGSYQSNELSRFRHSKRKYRTCPLCGHSNQITNERYCDKTLLLVEYDTTDINMDFWPENQPLPVPHPGGHGADGPGGHYVGPCYCSPIGCDPAEHTDGGDKGPCFPNPFCDANRNGINMANPNFALVAEEHIRGWVGGDQWQVGQRVYVISAPAAKINNSFHNPSSSSYNPSETQNVPILWQGGRMGGLARVVAWRKCGGHSRWNGWHGDKILRHVPWKSQEEDASILLLQEDGSTGLDLSFATHIFLLERVIDPALRNQIVSRAHRMGATGPVSVQLIQVTSNDDDL